MVWLASKIFIEATALELGPEDRVGYEEMEEEVFLYKEGKQLSAGHCGKCLNALLHIILPTSL